MPDDRTGTGLVADMTVMENLSTEIYRLPGFSKRGMLNFKALASRAAQLMDVFDIRCAGPGAPVRKPRTSRVLNSARSNMGVFHRSNAWSQAATYGPMKVADKLFPAFIRSRQDWIYGYDVRKVVV